MNIYLGNTTFNQVRERLGYQLTEEDRVIWNKYWNHKADLSGMESSFHIFDMPTEIHFKGEPAKNAILKMFTPDKLIESKGTFRVCAVS
jgi:hypothetical protein